MMEAMIVLYLFHTKCFFESGRMATVLNRLITVQVLFSASWL